MKVTQVSIRPTEAANAAGRPALTPELMAASGARYSRNNEGLGSILEKIDFGNREEIFDEVENWLKGYYDKCADFDAKGEVYPVDANELSQEAMRFVWKMGEVRQPQLDKGVDGIFKMIDYGHASIADMTPVALFIDDVSLFLAYYIWSVCPVAGGQESSTRYIRLGLEGVVSADELDIPLQHRERWQKDIENSFVLYERAVNYWENVAVQNPSVTGIPKALLDDSSDKAQKAVARMKRNYAFDRARYFLPMAAATNLMLVQSARQWVVLCQWLLSSPLKEFQTAGNKIREELGLAAPRLIRHAIASPEFTLRHTESLTEAQDYLNNHLNGNRATEDTHPANSVYPTSFFDVFAPRDLNDADITNATKGRKNRYSPFGTAINRIQVRFGWDAVAMAEIRDLNRHRTGTKWCPLAPVGFYCALDQVVQAQAEAGTLIEDSLAGAEYGDFARSLLVAGDPTYPYFTVLGTQYPFEHSTTANNFLYEAELRTGTGAHFRYARHLRDTLNSWYVRYPDTKGLIFEGSAEPE